MAGHSNGTCPVLSSPVCCSLDLAVSSGQIVYLSENRKWLEWMNIHGYVAFIVVPASGHQDPRDLGGQRAECGSGNLGVDVSTMAFVLLQRW